MYIIDKSSSDVLNVRGIGGDGVVDVNGIRVLNVMGSGLTLKVINSSNLTTVNVSASRTTVNILDCNNEPNCLVTGADSGVTKDGVLISKAKAFSSTHALTMMLTGMIADNHSANYIRSLTGSMPSYDLPFPTPTGTRPFESEYKVYGEDGGITFYKREPRLQNNADPQSLSMAVLGEITDNFNAGYRRSLAGGMPSYESPFPKSTNNNNSQSSNKGDDLRPQKMKR
jgi:hypothetical protein